ncbi:hypothetical protein Dfri01_46850 [Dyadobacter frigoris]|uniref:tetratricopeptide repeat-containing sensor histidine kinase n=1 Tax=Dyadobacter frigoris TaxID=2576211 RepID=UPI00249FBB35|nr:histidine kinase dimerization/phosphoacceptor domain -containing protein [Dyadobacter frigoris]GLU55224.1 hypothetical protein Dfri01_46850 [Dyadobacter frigoris]
MKVKNSLVVFCILFLSALDCGAQTTTGTLVVPRYPGISTDSIRKELRSSRHDTLRVKSLLKLSSIYFRRRSIDLKNLDTALVYAKDAAKLSRILKFKSGYDQAVFLLCKTYIDIPDVINADNILKSTFGEQKVRLLLVIGEHYMYQPGEKPENLNKAFLYLKSAETTGQKIKSVHWINEAIIALGKYYFISGNFNMGKQNFLKVISYYQKTGDTYKQAEWWSDLGRYLPENDSTFLYKLSCKSNAVNLFQNLKKEKEMAHEWFDMADINKNHNRFKEAEQQYLKAIAIYKKIGHQSLANASTSLAESYQFEGNVEKALIYALQGLYLYKQVKGSSSLISYSYMILGDIYRELGEPEKSVIYYRKTLDITINSAFTDYFGYIPIKRLSEGLIQQDRAKEALDFIRNFSLRRPAINAIDRQILANSIADCYNALKNYKTAEKYYLQMIRLDEPAELSKGKQIIFKRSITGSEAYYVVSKFYVEQKQYEKAAPYLSKALTMSRLSPVLEKDIKLIESQIDSAAGNYLHAMMSYKRHTQLKDSIANVSKTKQLSTLKIQFETSQKENDIKLLRKEALLQKRQLELSTQTRNFTLGGILMLFLLLGVSYNRFRLKQRKNLLLEEQQKIINIKNVSLLNLIDEKEWLLKEVHHRVKNNLQIIVSLLNTQSVYLKDETAVNAILESRHRVQAMSMLHQRIYQSDNMSGISMSPYIHELVGYLVDSFNTGLSVIFNISIDDIDLDLNKAVPIGLILNEAVTNALKYAFPNKMEGIVHVILARQPDNYLLLQIQDNGIGLPEEFNFEEIKSFGIKLIKGLSEDLGGEMVIANDKGIRIEIRFENIVSTHQTMF